MLAYPRFPFPASTFFPTASLSPRLRFFRARRCNVWNSTRILLSLRRICNNQPFAALFRVGPCEKTVSQLSAAGCRTLWLDHGLHPDPAEKNTSDSAETEMPGDFYREISGGSSGESARESSRDAPEERSRDFFGKKSRGITGKSSREKSGEKSRESSSGGATDVLPAERRGKAGGSDGGGEEGGESSRHKWRLSMVLDVKGGRGSAGMVGSSEWLLR